MNLIKPCYNEERSILAEQIPLPAPFSITLTPSSACIFKCVYCPHSLPAGTFTKKNMRWDTFKKIVGQIEEFDTKLKAIHFQGMGEPLINKELPKMIAYVKERDIAEHLNLVTNGALLTEPLSLSLISSGIDTIKISLQGMTGKKYHEICGYDIDFDGLVNNIRFLYENKQDCEIFVKVADISLEAGDVNRFYTVFCEISDRANIEYIRPMFSDVDYKNINPDAGLNMYAQPHRHYEVCSLGFFMMYINSEGGVYPCCNHLDPAGWGNIYQTTLKEIWTGNERKHFLRMMFWKERNHQDKYPVCKNCNIPDAVLRKEDIVDEFLCDDRRQNIVVQIEMV